MMAPFMSCGARLAIFAVFAGAFFGQGGALVIFSLYLLGIVVAILTGLLLKHTLMRGEASPFVMELPLYHVPHLKSLLLQTWSRLRGFVVRAGKVIILVSLVIGGLNSITLDGKPVQGDIGHSALASVSQRLTPLLAPLGVQPDNWQATVGLVTGAMAKEVVVGTLNTLYTAEQIQGEAFDYEATTCPGNCATPWSRPGTAWSIPSASACWPTRWRRAWPTATWRPARWAPWRASSAAPSRPTAIWSSSCSTCCVTAMGAIARESSKGWMAFSVLWGLNVAYSLATLCYQVATFAAHPERSVLTIAVVLLFNLILMTCLRLFGREQVLQLPGRMADAPSGQGGCH